jgi:hypothetical protein
MLLKVQVRVVGNKTPTQHDVEIVPPLLPDDPLPEPLPDPLPEQSQQPAVCQNSNGP